MRMNSVSNINSFKQTFRRQIMNIRTRHLGILTYFGLALMVIFKDILTDPVHIVALLAPIIVLASVDKIEALARNTSNKDANTATT